MSIPDYEPNEPDFEHEDPMWYEAEIWAEVELEGIRDDLDEAIYARELERITLRRFHDLKGERDAMIAEINSLSPEDLQTWLEWDGQKPPEDEE